MVNKKRNETDRAAPQRVRLSDTQKGIAAEPWERRCECSGNGNHFFPPFAYLICTLLVRDTSVKLMNHNRNGFAHSIADRDGSTSMPAYRPVCGPSVRAIAMRVLMPFSAITLSSTSMLHPSLFAMYARVLPS